MLGYLGAGDRGSMAVGDLGVGSSLALETWESGIGVPWRWRHGDRDSLALENWVSDIGVPYRWRPGGRGFSGVGDLEVGGSLALGTWRSGIPRRWRPGGRGFPGVGDLGVGGSLAMDTWVSGIGVPSVGDLVVGVP